MTEKDILRGDRAALEQALIEAGATIRGRSVLCPFHDDKHPSGSIYENEKIWRYKCMACGAGGDVFDIRALVAGTSPGEELKRAAGPKPQSYTPAKRSAPTFANLDAVRAYMVQHVGRIEAEHVYTGPDGDTVQVVFRCRTSDGKTFRPVHLTDRGYILGAAPKHWPLYRLSELVKAETVVIVEGEKCADALIRFGFTATTSAGGAKNARSSDWMLLAGKTVILWPDADPEGRRYAADVEGILQGLSPAPRISIVSPSELDLAEHEDAADFVSQLQITGRTDAEIKAAIDSAIKKAGIVSLTAAVRQRIADIRAGRYAAIPFQFPILSNLTNALLPGERTTIAGPPGALKSIFGTQQFTHWSSIGLKVAWFMAEQDRVFHTMRALAQHTGNSWLTDPTAVKERADEADAITAGNSEFIDTIFGRAIHTTSEVQSLRQLCEWIEQRAKLGCRIIGADPVTAFLKEGRTWEADDSFVRSVERIAKTYGCSVILVTHSVKNATNPDMSQVAGGASFIRFTQTVIWLEYHSPEKVSRIRTPCGPAEYEHAVTIHILKANNKTGKGYRIAYEFDVESLTFSELGVILGKSKK